jgi:hypothetical protein
VSEPRTTRVNLCRTYNALARMVNLFSEGGAVLTAFESPAADLPKIREEIDATLKEAESVLSAIREAQNA